MNPDTNRCERLRCGRRPRRSAQVALVLAATTLVASACSGGDDSADTTAATTTSTSTTTTVARTTTTPAPTTTTEKPTTTTTEKKRPKKPVWPLTGLGDPDKDLAKLPALIVKIDNASGARPQTGFNEADLVYEEIVNDSLTRFGMVFHSHGSDVVGPIRSGRIQDIDLFGSLHGPLFAWSGGNATVTAAIRASDLIEIGPTRAPAAYYRSSDRSAPHNLYSSTLALLSYAPPEATAPPQQFRYRDKGERVRGEPANGVTITMDSVDVRWDWDPASNTYLRTMDGVPHLDRASGQVSTDNVVVLYMNYANGISGSPDAQSVGTGDCLVFSRGRWIVGHWSRADRLKPFTLRDNSGRPIELTPGRTFVELPRPATAFPILP